MLQALIQGRVRGAQQGAETAVLRGTCRSREAIPKEAMEGGAPQKEGDEEASSSYVKRGAVSTS